MQFDDALLHEYIGKFFGYGNYSGDYWLVGMEEGGGDTTAEIRSRLNAWNRRERPELDDVAGFHRETGLDKWFRPNPPLQPTWRMLIRLLLSAQGEPVPVNVDAVRSFQGGVLGKAGGTNAILERLPLPSPSTGHWLYADHSHLSFLRNREMYRGQIAPARVHHLRTRIQEHKPKAVIFSGLEYREWWEAIAGVEFSEAYLRGFHTAQHAGTVFAMTRHPTSFGITSAYFETGGTIIAKHREAMR